MGLKAFLILILLTMSTFANDSLTKVSLQLLWKHQFEFAGFYMAKEKGYYKDAGLEVELKEFKKGTNIVSDIEQGKSTFGIGYPNIILNKSNGAKINIISAVFQSSPHVFITLDSSNIKSIKDFKHKKVMIENDAIKTAPLLSLLYSQNIKLDDITIIPPSFNINNLKDGTVDIYSAFISNEVYKLKKENIKYTVWDPKDYGFDFYNDIIFTSTKELKTHPRLVERFREASLKGWKYAFNHIDETIDLILKKYNTQHKTKDAYLYEAKELKRLAYLNTDELGKIDKVKIQRIIDIYNLMGFIKKPIDIDEFVYNPYSPNISLTKKEKEFIKKNPVIKIDNELFAAPYNFRSKDEAKGFSVDFIKLLAKKLGMKAEFIPIKKSSEIIPYLQNKQIDVVLNISKTPSREKILNFTTPYLKAKKAIFTNNINLKTLNDLTGKKVAVVNTFFIHKFLKKHYPQITIVPEENFKKTISAVTGKNADALIGEYSIIDYILRQNRLHLNYSYPLNDFEIQQDLHLGIRKDLVTLKDILQKAMNSITEKEMNSLKNKWLIPTFDPFQQKINFSAKEEKYLQKKKEITMCVDPDWMPFEKLEKNKHIGISADYFKLFEYNLNKNIRIIPTNSWSQSLQYAKSRKCDLLSLAMATPERKKYMNFTTPYLKIPLVIATKLDVTFINDFKALKDKKVGIPKGYAFAEILRKKYPYINIVEVKDIRDGLQQVKEGKLFGYIGTLASVGYMFQTEFTGELKIAGKFNEQWKLGIGVRNDDPILLSIMQKLVDSIQTAQSQTILNNWLAIKYEQKVDYKFLWQILVVVAIIIFLFIYRQYVLFQSNRKLKKAVDEKTKELRELNKNLEQKVKDSIIEIRQKDNILYEQSKMAAMGEMIGNISHQWRQPLSIISTAASGIKMKIEFGMFNKEEEKKSLDAITEATQYLSETIDDFRNFLKPNQEKKYFNVKTVIDKTISMFGNSFQNNNINFIIEIDDCNILGSENELLQVMINILNNSKDAFKEQNMTENQYIFISLEKFSNHIIIYIKDSAGGIDQEALASIFEPYFTTKHQSIGTGIGLYMSYQIIRNKFNGNIIASNINYHYNEFNLKGAQFEIILPFDNDKN